MAVFYTPEALLQSPAIALAIQGNLERPPMRPFPLISMLSMAAVILAGCDSSTSSPAAAESPKPTPVQGTSKGPTSAEVTQASTETAKAYQALFQQSTVDASNPMGSSTTTLSNANASLQKAYTANPTDSRAAFALAITGLSLKVNTLAGTFQRAQANGLELGGPTSNLPVSPTAVTNELPVLARAVSNPAKAPLVHELQDSLELLLIPTLDSAINLLTTSWSDTGFEFRVAFDPANFPGDTIIIDRADVGMALSVLQAFRAEIRWMISYNLDVDLNGSYAWSDTLDNINPDVALSPAQSAAFEKAKSLLAPGSSFLAVRPAKAAFLASVPVELRTALQRMRESTSLAYRLKTGAKRHIPTITTTQVRDQFFEVIDSGLAKLAGPSKTVLYAKVSCKESSTVTVTSNGTTTNTYASSYDFYHEYKIFSAISMGCRSGVYDDSSDYGGGLVYHYHDVVTASSQTQTVLVDLSKLLSLPDLKVFLPRYTWNALPTWNDVGPFNLVGTDNIASNFKQLGDLGDTKGFDGVKNRISWLDPSFGGVFPELKTSGDVMELFRASVDDGNTSPTIAARGPLALF